MASNGPIQSFHLLVDDELSIVARPRAVSTARQRKRLTIQEREIGYRFTPHFHPYVGELGRRLLRESVAGLQAADTLYAPDGASLPSSVDLELRQETALVVAAGARFSLRGDATATLPNGDQMPLAANLRLAFAVPPRANVAAGTRARLDDGLAPTPAVGAEFPLAGAMGAALAGDTEIALAADAAITLPDGTAATISVDTAIFLRAESPLTLPAATPVRLLASKPRPIEALYADLFGAAEQYQPSPMVQRPYPVKDLDFSAGGAYAVYNWELFFHVPFAIAVHLSKNQRFAEAQRWFHLLFDPTDDSDAPAPAKFWKVRPFQTTDVKKIEEILVNLSTKADPTLRKETVQAIEAWRAAPFRPHLVARYRQQAYMLKTVMAYLDNLIAWGDALFRQDTGESVDEALMLYVLAANILGPRPQPVPKKGSVRPQTYANLRGDLEQFGVVLRELEADPPFDLMPFPAAGGVDGGQLAPLRGLGRALYFCVPRNDHLLAYWDTVADRLFKIRNSLNLQGTFRQLALFEPPIDPALLARATAAGLDVGAIVNGLNQPLPLVRFALLAQKAAEICQEVKSLGANLLAALEKEDGEALSALRARHERVVLELAEQVRYGQLQEAGKAREAVVASLAQAIGRYTFYERQLGRSAEDIARSLPELDDLDEDGLAKLKFAMAEPAVEPRPIPVDIAQDLGASGGKIVSSHEAEELAKSQAARDLQEIVKALNLGAQMLALIPDFDINLHFWGLGGSSTIAGGSKLSDAARFAANIVDSAADGLNFEAGRAAKIGSYARREQDWAFQSATAAGEITQVLKQVRAAQIREAIAKREWHNHQHQIRHAQEVEFFLTGEKNAEWRHRITPTAKKATNQGFYTWMKREVRALYGQCFQFAFDTAKKAERALQHELGDSSLRFLEFGYLAGKEGLVAGEKLHLDIKRMEMAYYDLNRREYELTKHVSLLQVDPVALVSLRATGACTVRLPESLFDLDGPGHFFRRIKSVAVSIPCVAGPYAGVPCTLTLLRSSIRTTPVLLGGAYARDDAEDDRFDDYAGSLQSIVTSSAQNDSGLFETNLRDERYLPFENAGVIGEWRLELPADPTQNDPRPFDYQTISDVVLHLRYTAREGGGLLRRGATANLRERIAAAEAAGSVRLFSVRHEFPDEWARFVGQEVAAGARFKLSIPLRSEHYPYWSQDRLDAVHRADLWVRGADPAAAPATMDVFAQAVGDPPDVARATLAKDKPLGNLLVGTLNELAPTKPDAAFDLFFPDKAFADLWLAITWKGDS